MASTSTSGLVSDTIIDTSATPEQVTISITMATLLLVLILLHVIFYIVVNRKLEEWYDRLRSLLPRSRTQKTPRVTVMNVKPMKNPSRTKTLPSSPVESRPKTAAASWDRVSRPSDSPRQLERSYSIPPSSNGSNIVTLHDLQSFSLEMDQTFSGDIKEQNLNAQKAEMAYTNGKIEMQNPVVQNVKLQMEMEERNSSWESAVNNGNPGTTLYPNNIYKKDLCNSVTEL